jgi:hypothetical protein
MVIGLAVATVAAAGANGHIFCATSRVSNSDTIDCFCGVHIDSFVPN